MFFWPKSIKFYVVCVWGLLEKNSIEKVLEFEKKVNLFKLSGIIEQEVKIGGFWAIKKELKGQILR